MLYFRLYFFITDYRQLLWAAVATIDWKRVSEMVKSGILRFSNIYILNINVTFSGAVASIDAPQVRRRLVVLLMLFNVVVVVVVLCVSKLLF